MTISKGLLMPVLCAAVCLAGCQNGSGRRRIDTGGSAREQLVPSELVGQTRTPIHDIPVPLQFELDQDRSRSWATGGIRVVDHRYVGPDDKWAVGRFYRRQMPNYQWVAVSAQQILGRISLRFVKGNQRCVVEIDDDGSWTSSGTGVNVQIFPEIRDTAGEMAPQN